MKKSFQQKLWKPLIATTMLAGLFSLTAFAGGDVYEIYLNDKLVCRETYKTVSGSKELHLDKLNANDKLVIKYSHCGAVGKNRSIVIKDEKNNIIKEWKFTDGQNSSVMQIPVKELLSLKANNTSLKLYYSAQQMPEGKMLTAIKIDNKKVAASNATTGNIFLAAALSCLLNPLRLRLS